MATTTTTTKTPSLIGTVIGVAITCGIIYLAAWSASKGWSKGSN